MDSHGNLQRDYGYSCSREMRSSMSKHKITSTDLTNGNGALCPCILAIWRVQFTYFLSVVQEGRLYKKTRRLNPQIIRSQSCNSLLFVLQK